MSPHLFSFASTSHYICTSKTKGIYNPLKWGGKQKLIHTPIGIELALCLATSFVEIVGEEIVWMKHYSYFYALTCKPAVPCTMSPCYHMQKHHLWRRLFFLFLFNVVFFGKCIQVAECSFILMPDKTFLF